LDSYVIRIYRRGDDPAEDLVGIVEKAGGSAKKAFRNFEELRKILRKGRVRKNESVPER
jgi:hypothetical protein